MFDANNMPILCQLAPPRLRATGYGLLTFAGIGAGGVETAQDRPDARHQQPQREGLCDIIIRPHGQTQRLVWLGIHAG